VKKRAKNKFSRNIIVVVFLIFVGFITFLYSPILFSENPKRKNQQTKETPKIQSRYPFGIDVSEYQGIIDWVDVKDSYHNVSYVLMRSSMGVDGKDKFFERNWSYTKQLGFIRGAYHFYRPNEDAEAQFRNFVSTVAFEKGDLFPVLDVEATSKKGNKYLVDGVNTWLRLAEKHFGVKPLLYTYKNFYNDELKGKVEGYPIWVAAYTDGTDLSMIDHVFHQYSDSERISGIPTEVDANKFKDSTKTIQEYCFK
jgi:lysozyme